MTLAYYGVERKQTVHLTRESKVTPMYEPTYRRGELLKELLGVVALILFLLAVATAAMWICMPMPV